MKLLNRLKYRYKLWKCKNTCIFGSVYTLLLYLLHCPDDELAKTFYLCYAPSADHITKHLPISDNCYELWWDRVDKQKLWRYRLKSLTTYFPLLFTKKYAQVDACGATQIINHTNYTLIEDGHGYFTYAYDSPHVQPFDVPKTFWGFKQKLKFGPLHGKRMGQNKQCIDRLITADHDTESPWIKGRKYTLLDIQELWNKASEYKKKFILDVYDIQSDVVDKLKDYKTIILTQPWAEAFLIPEKEVLDIYAPYVEQYKNTGVVIKPHPREKDIDYAKHFQNVFVWQTRAPLQIFMLMGIEFENVITVNSSAISLFPSTTNIVWLGSEVHSVILDRCGHAELQDFINHPSK